MARKNKDGVKYIALKKADLERRFKEYNEMYFDGVLPDCRLRITKNGFCPAWYIVLAKKPHIYISNRYYWTDNDLKLTLIHEMVHYYIDRILKKWTFSTHGYTFNHECSKLRDKYGLRVKLYELPFKPHKGKKEPTLIKRMWVYFLYRFIAPIVPL